MARVSEYQCWLPDEEESAMSIAAWDAWSAAKSFAQRYDQASGGEVAQGALRGGHKLRVHVRAPGDIESAWDVWPEAEIRWYGSAVIVL